MHLLTDAEEKPLIQRFKRSNSMPHLFKSSKIELESEACQARDGALWKCVGRRPSHGGYIYLYQSRDEYNDYNHSLI